MNLALGKTHVGMGILQLAGSGLGLLIGAGLGSLLLGDSQAQSPTQNAKLSWERNPETNVVYVIHRGVTPGVRLESREVGSVTNTIWVGVSQTNYFTITAKLGNLESGHSSEVLYVPPTLPPPVVVLQPPTGLRVEQAW